MATRQHDFEIYQQQQQQKEKQQQQTRFMGLNLGPRRDI